MKKLFIAICFIALSCIQPVEARIKEVLDIKNVPQPQQQPADYKPKNHMVSEEDFDNFIIDRLSKTVIVSSSSSVISYILEYPGTRISMLATSGSLSRGFV